MFTPLNSKDIRVIKYSINQTYDSYYCTAFEWNDSNKNEYYFHLQWGIWTIYNRTTHETLAYGTMQKRVKQNFSWKDIVKLAKQEGIILL